VHHTAQGLELFFSVSFHSAEKTEWKEFPYFYSSGMRLLELCSMEKGQMTNEYEISDPQTSKKGKNLGRYRMGGYYKVSSINRV
jgi:hypothetical protein